MQAVVLSLFLHEWALNGGAFRLVRRKKLDFLDFDSGLIWTTRFRGVVLINDNLIRRKLAQRGPSNMMCREESISLENVDAVSILFGIFPLMQNVFQFLSTSDESVNRDRFIASFQNLISDYGFDFYRVSRRTVDDLTLTGSILAERLPDGWSAVYHAKKYGNVDPVKRTLGLAQKPFRWRDVVGLLPQAAHRKRASKLFQDAARFGLREGYAFPIHGRSGLLGGVFIGGQGCHFTNSELAILDAAMRATFWKLLNFTGQSKSILSIPDLSAAQLTRRELDVLVLLSQGNTSPEIAKSLSISSHTVDWYINGIQRKFDAKNRQHVIALAFRHGLIA